MRGVATPVGVFGRLIVRLSPSLGLGDKRASNWLQPVRRSFFVSTSVNYAPVSMGLLHTDIATHEGVRKFVCEALI